LQRTADSSTGLPYLAYGPASVSTTLLCAAAVARAEAVSTAPQSWSRLLLRLFSVNGRVRCGPVAAAHPLALCCSKTSRV
jgi:hypothetical protein